MSDLCLSCNYSITEPLCASCIINEINIWFCRQHINKEVIKKINEELEWLLNEIESFDYASFPSRNMKEESILKCIKCKKGMHLTCFYCVINQASQIAKDNLKDEKDIESFHEVFNTDLYDHIYGFELNKENNLLSI